MDPIESTRINFVQWLRLAVEATGALVIAVGVIMAPYGFARALTLQRPESYVEVRLTLARYLALAIEFQLAADILSSAISPSWDQIGQLGAIVVIRTGLTDQVTILFVSIGDADIQILFDRSILFRHSRMVVSGNPSCPIRMDTRLILLV